MGLRRSAFTVALGAVLLLVTAATNGPKPPEPPSISFEVHPTFVGCVADQPPVTVALSWHIVHPVTSATITGTVDKLGNPLPPVRISTKRGRNGVIGTRKVRMPCVSSAQTLTLTAVGPGGTKTTVLTLNENRAD